MGRIKTLENENLSLRSDKEFAVRDVDHWKDRYSECERKITS